MAFSPKLPTKRDKKTASTNSKSEDKLYNKTHFLYLCAEKHLSKQKREPLEPRREAQVVTRYVKFAQPPVWQKKRVEKQSLGWKLHQGCPQKQVSLVFLVSFLVPVWFVVPGPGQGTGSDLRERPTLLQSQGFYSLRLQNSQEAKQRSTPFPRLRWQGIPPPKVYKRKCQGAQNRHPFHAPRGNVLPASL